LALTIRITRGLQKEKGGSQGLKGEKSCHENTDRWRRLRAEK